MWNFIIILYLSHCNIYDTYIQLTTRKINITTSTNIIIQRHQSLVYESNVFNFESATFISLVAYSTYNFHIKFHTLVFSFVKITLSSYKVKLIVLELFAIISVVCNILSKILSCSLIYVFWIWTISVLDFSP